MFYAHMGKPKHKTTKYTQGKYTRRMNEWIAMDGYVEWRWGRVFVYVDKFWGEIFWDGCFGVYLYVSNDKRLLKFRSIKNLICLFSFIREGSIGWWRAICYVCLKVKFAHDFEGGVLLLPHMGLFFYRFLVLIL